MTEVELRELTHVRLLVHHEVGDPLIICREDVERLCSDDGVERIGRAELTVDRRSVLDKDVVVDPVVAVQYRHEACNLCPVADVVWSVTRLSLAVLDTVHAGVDEAETTADEVVDYSYSFARYRNGYVREHYVIVDESRAVTDFDEYVGSEHGSVSLLYTFRSLIVVEDILRYACALSFPVEPYAFDAVVDVIAPYRYVDGRMELDAGSLCASELCGITDVVDVAVFYC